MAEFAGSGGNSRDFSGSRGNEFHKVKVPPPKQRAKSNFWKLVMEVADGYRGKINPQTHRRYTKEERLHIGLAVAGKVASGQRRGRKTEKPA